MIFVDLTTFTFGFCGFCMSYDINMLHMLCQKSALTTMQTN